MGVSRDIQYPNKVIVREFFDSLSAGEFARAGRLIKPEGSWSVPRRRLVNRLDDQLKIIEGESPTFVLGELTAEENRVSALAEGCISRADGRTSYKTYHFLIRIEDQLIGEVIMYDDHGFAERADTESAAGLVPPVRP